MERNANAGQLVAAARANGFGGMKRVMTLAAFAATIPAANWMIENVGTCAARAPCTIPVGFGLDAPSGVLLIGLALVLRDALHEIGGLRIVVCAIACGVALTFAFSAPSLAVASAAAFLIGEGVDAAVYSPLRRRGLAIAVFASGVAGAAVDSAAFLWLAFGALEFAPGLVLAKLYASTAVAAFLMSRAALRAIAEVE